MEKYATPDNYALWVALTRAYYYMHKIREKELHRIGLTVAQSTVLDIIDELDKSDIDVILVEISKRLLKAASTTTEIMKRMEVNGLVRRIQDLDRKNIVRIEMTDRGKALYEQSRGVKYLKDVFTKVTPGRRYSLLTYLNKLTEAAMNLAAKRRRKQGAILYYPFA